MLQISQPFSCLGPTRMSQKRNLSGLSVLGRKACNKVASTPTLDSTCSTQDAASALYFRDGARQSLQAPSVWTFRADLVVGVLI